MFHSSKGLNAAAEQRSYSDKECRVDPEQMLQQARAWRTSLEEAKRNLHSLANNTHVSLSGDQFLMALGQVEIDLIRAIQNEERWLAEIDKP